MEAIEIAANVFRTIMYFLTVTTVLVFALIFMLSYYFHGLENYPLLYPLFPQLRSRKMAREVAIWACKKLFPDEPVFGAGICADEPDRYVVRVCYGNRSMSDMATFRLPPWRECLIVAVQKDTYVDEVIVDDGKYRPMIR
jgi:hypothetical protein